jgi:hypothetical protein
MRRRHRPTISSKEGRIDFILASLSLWMGEGFKRLLAVNGGGGVR